VLEKGGEREVVDESGAVGAIPCLKVVVEVLGAHGDRWEGHRFGVDSANVGDYFVLVVDVDEVDGDVQAGAHRAREQEQPKGGGKKAFAPGNIGQAVHRGVG